MIEYNLAHLFGEDSVSKEIIISTDDNSVIITNTELHNEAFTLKESISPKKRLVFGHCEASTIKFTVSNVFSDLKNQWITVRMILNHDKENFFQIGRFKVYSDVPTANRKKRNVTAYDALYEILNSDITDWYNGMFPKASTKVTLKEFRDSFFAHFGIEQEESSLVNDSMYITKTISEEKISGKQIINAICEINGCFGHIGRNGKFKYVFLEKITEGLYPSQDLYPSENLFPRESNSIIIKNGTYIPPCTYEDYKVKKITGLQIIGKTNEVISEVGSNENVYVISKNFLIYGKKATETKEIAEKILEKISGIMYTPFNTSAKGNLCLEVGDAIRLNTKTKIIESYILQRTLSGIQSLRDIYLAEGEEYQPKRLNSVSQSIENLNAKAESIKQSQNDLDDKITVRLEELDESIIAEVKRASDVEGDLSSRIEVALTGIDIKMVDESGLTTGIKITMTKENGEKSDVSGNINIKGFVTFDDLKGEGSTTTINGALIETGTIKADRIDLESFTELPTLTTNTMLVTNYMEVTSEDSSAYLVSDNLSVDGSASVGSLKVYASAITVGNFEATWQSTDVLDADGNVITIEYLGLEPAVG